MNNSSKPRQNITRQMTQQRSVVGIIGTPLNLFIVLLGFTCVVIGYIVSNTPRDQLAAFFGSIRPSVERSQTR